MDLVRNLLGEQNNIKNKKYIYMVKKSPDIREFDVDVNNQDLSLVPLEPEVEEGSPLIDVEASLLSFPPKNIISVEPVVLRMTAQEVTDICYKLCTWYGVHEQTIVAALSEMIRKGGANKATPPTFSIEIICPYSDPGNIHVNIEKRDVIRAIEMVCPDKKF